MTFSAKSDRVKTQKEHREDEPTEKGVAPMNSEEPKNSVAGATAKI